MLKAVVFAVAAITPVLCAYPSTYPFENEVYAPAMLPEATPTYVYDETDTGGYIYTGIQNYFLTEEAFYAEDGETYEGWGWTAKSMYQGFLLVNSYGVPPILPLTVFNCTAPNKPPFTDEMFLGMAGNMEVCKIGSCCSHLIDTPSWGPSETWHSWLDNLVSGGLCKDAPHEEIYCIYAAGHAQINCLQMNINVLERLYVYPCHDFPSLYWLSCPLSKTAGQPEATGKLEPQSYYADMTPQQTIEIGAMHVFPDRVCRPYSYFYPLEVDSVTSSSKSDVSASESATESSGAYAYFIDSMLLLLIVCYLF